MHVLLFLDVSGGELLVVLLFVLLFFGSKGVPEVARTMGRALRQFRDATADVQREISKGANDVKKGFEEQRKVFSIEPPEQTTPQRTTGGAAATETVTSPDQPPASAEAPTTAPSTPVVPAPSGTERPAAEK